MKQILIKRLYLTAIVAIFALFFVGTPTLLAQATTPQKTVTESDAVKYFNKARNNKTELRELIRRLPKGGELHTHLSGTPTPERLLELTELSKRFKYYVRVPAQLDPDDPAAYQLIAMPPGKTPEPETGYSFVAASALLKPSSDKERAQREAFRQANIINEGETIPLNIFYGAIFQRRGQVVNSSEMVPHLVTDAVRQAHRDRLSYLELQLSPFPIEPLQNLWEVNRIINMTAAREYLNKLIISAREANAALPENERVEVKFILAFSRTSAKVFLYLPIAFELAAANDEIAKTIAGINIVGNEYSQDQRIGQVIAGPEHLRDYIFTLHHYTPGKVRAGTGISAILC
jgi:adenosine deaminase CECR1